MKILKIPESCYDLLENFDKRTKTSSVMTQALVFFQLAKNINQNNKNVNIHELLIKADIQAHYLLNKHKEKARTIIAEAIRKKSLTRQPCEVCGNLKVEAHHENYHYPLDVIWLCKKHHEELHKIKMKNEKTKH